MEMSVNNLDIVLNFKNNERSMNIASFNSRHKKYFFVCNMSLEGTTYYDKVTDEYTMDMIKKCPDYCIFELYKLLIEPSNYILIKLIEMFTKTQIVELCSTFNDFSEIVQIEIIKKLDDRNTLYLYKKLVNPSENLTIQFIKSNNDNVLKMFQLIKDPSDKIIKFCAIYSNNKLVILYQMLKNPSVNITFYFINRCKTFPDESTFIDYKSIFLYEIFKVIVNPTKNMLFDTLNNIYTRERKCSVIIHYGLTEELYIECYSILKADYLSHIISPSHEFLCKIVEKNWFNLKNIKANKRTEGMYKLACEQSILACMFSYNKNVNEYFHHDEIETEMSPFIKKNI